MWSLDAVFFFLNSLSTYDSGNYKTRRFEGDISSSDVKKPIIVDPLNLQILAPIRAGI